MIFNNFDWKYSFIKYFFYCKKVGRGKHCTPERRELIKKLIQDYKTYKEVEKLIGCSSKLISNALKYEKKR